MNLSVLIPARHERYLGRTIQDVLDHAERQTEVIAVLDGYWPDPPIYDRPGLVVVHYPESIGQRGATNAAAPRWMLDSGSRESLRPTTNSSHHAALPDPRDAGTMKLIGMFYSPYVRRVAVTLKHLEVPFEHANWSVGADFERIREFSPLGRVPVLVLDDGTALMDSAAMLDAIDDQVGPTRALLPASGGSRREALRLISLAIGAGEKARDQLYERMVRPPEKYHEPWVKRCREQVHGALGLLEVASHPNRFSPSSIKSPSAASSRPSTDVTPTSRPSSISSRPILILRFRTPAMPQC